MYNSPKGDGRTLIHVGAPDNNKVNYLIYYSCLLLNGYVDSFGALMSE